MRFYDVWTRNKTDETDASYLGCFENTNEKRALKDAYNFLKGIEGIVHKNYKLEIEQRYELDER